MCVSVCAYLPLFKIYLYIFKLEQYLTLRISHALILTASPSTADVKRSQTVNLQRKCFKNGRRTPFFFFPFFLLKLNFFKKDVSRKKTKPKQNQCLQSSRRAWGACCLPQLGPDLPSVSPQPFMSPRYAGGPRPPIRMGNQVLCSRASCQQVSWGWLLFGEGDKAPGSSRCSLGLDGQHHLPSASSSFWLLEHQVSHSQFILILF